MYQQEQWCIHDAAATEKRHSVDTSVCCTNPERIAASVKTLSAQAVYVYMCMYTYIYVYIYI